MKLEDFLPANVVREIERENLAGRRHRGRALDEHELRYIFMSVLGEYKIPCPHPWRKEVNSHAFECRMCRALVVELAS